MSIVSNIVKPIVRSIVRPIVKGIVQRYFTEAFAVASSRIDLTTPIPIGAEVTMLVYPTSGNTGLPSDAPLVTDNKLQEITFTLTASMASIFYNGTNYFSGIIANVVATQGGTVLLSMPINESGVSNTVIDYSGQNNHGTRVNMTADNTALYVKEGDAWRGVANLIINGDFSNGLTGWPSSNAIVTDGVLGFTASGFVYQDTGVTSVVITTATHAGGSFPQLALGIDSNPLGRLQFNGNVGNTLDDVVINQYLEII